MRNAVSKFTETVRAIAAANPEATAVEAGTERLSYRELDGRTAELARRLRARGVGRGAVVGISLDRSPALVAVMLGVLRAGAAWLPLEPSYPGPRLASLVGDSGAALVVADGRAAAWLPAGVERLDPDDGGGPDAAWPDPAVQAEPDDVVYVIYTSGSTGRPKGVLATHRGLDNLADALSATFAVQPRHRVLQFAPSSFDASVFELAMALAAGATLVLAPPGALSGQPLLDLLREARITHATLPPSVLATLPEADLPDLEVLVCAGEALPGRLADRWRRGRRVVNAYGPTETAVWATLADVQPGEERPPIGAPIPGVSAAVVDAALLPVPDGRPGELAIGGAGVAMGYLGQPGLTAERFVPDPFAAEPGARLYRTGDLAVRRPDGELGFLGRLDHQVKLRGFRVEPDEVAHALREHPGVRDAAVVAVRGALRAYAVAPGCTRAELHAFLADRLPGHLVPAAIVLLPGLPLTASGKVDRQALPEPGRADAGLPDLPAAPRTDLERRLAGLVGDVLGVGAVGVHDDFFALGGHSLLAGRLAARARSELGAELPLVRLFETPTVAGMAAALGAAPSAPAPPPIHRAARDRPIPLSLPQERVWFIEALAPGSLAYHAQATIRLRGPLAVAVLEAALTELVRRHEILRTAFRQEPAGPVQQPGRPWPVDVPVVDVGALPGAERDAAAEAAVAEALRAPFDPGRPPLVRWMLVRHAPDDHTLVQVEHHLVHDGWSFALLLTELGVLYEAFAAGAPSPLPEPPVQYADFAVWQREWMTGDVLRRTLDHWIRRLAGAPTTLGLPTDRARPAAQGFAGAALRVELPAPVARRLRAHARARRATLFTVMLAGFAALLQRWTGQDDLLVGTGVANRRLVELESMPGMVVNTLVLRLDVSGRPSFDELVGRAYETVVDAHEWQDIPLERLVEALSPPRDPSRNPLFQAMFSFHNSPVPDLRFGRLAGEVLERHNGSAKMDLNVVVVPRAEQRAGRPAAADDDRLSLIWEYATDLFDEATIRRLAAHYEHLLTAAVAEPGLAVDRLPLEPAGVGDELAWNPPGPPYPAGRVVHGLFEEQARARPDRPAVRWGQEALTYSELDAAANRLAHRLREVGVGPDLPVGLLLERGPNLVVAALAALKAGGAYLPLDLDQPAPRLAALLADTGAVAVVTSSAFRDSVRGPAVVCLDAEAADLAARPSSPPAVTVHPRNLANVVHTSGSTGRPKAVMIEHRSVLRLVHGARYQEFGPDERFAQVASPSFDAMTYELWAALLHGATVCPVPRDVALAPGRLGAELRRHAVTTMFLTSALFEVVVDTDPDALAGLTNLLVGGEPLPPGPARTLLAGRRPRRLLNVYGPTEATTFAAWHLVERVPDRAARVPIGRPVGNTTLHVLDRHLRPVPAGVPGELFVGGPGLARGYAGGPGMTAERFVPDPFGDGERLYRTGDVARRLADGTIDHLGRADDQVKIRGFRVEPGELRAALLEHPAVRTAAVLVHERGGGPALTAYVVPAADRTVPSAAELRAFLAGRLPPYLHPAAWVFTDALPLTAQGKLDRAALRRLPVPAGPAGEHVAPRTGLERQLAELWVELLPVDRVGVRDDFFELGGHSLLAMRVAGLVRERLGLELPLRTLFDSPTVEALAAVLERADPAAGPAAGGGRPLTDGERRLWYLDRVEPRSPEYVVPVAWRLSGDVDETALERALGELLRRHAALWTRFVERDGRPAAEVTAARDVRLERVELAGGESELRALLRERARRGFDLTDPPLLRACLVGMGAGERALLLTAHHIVCDGWSLGVLARELGALYGAYRDGVPPPAAEPDRSPPARPAADEDLQHWRERLRDLPSLTLPTDRPRPAERSWEGADHELVLPTDLALRLRELGRAAGGTLFMILLAAFAALLSRYSGQRDVVVGTPVANRTGPGADRAVGFLVDTVVLRLDLGGEPGFLEVLRRVRETVVDAFDHQGAPFERLVAELRPERDPGRNPLFQVLFTMEPPAGDELRMPGVAVAQLAPDWGVAKFDLGLSVREAPDGGLRCRLNYRTDLFDAVRVERMAGHLDRLLREALASPDAPVRRLPILPDEERRLVLGAWSGGGRGTPDGRCLHELFEERARQHPDRVAVRCGGRRLSYGELDRRADGLAACLRRRGVGPEVPVGVCVERSPELVVALLGILKAGGAYVPLEPGHPAARLRLIADQARLRLLVATRAQADRFGWAGDVVAPDAGDGPVEPAPGGASPDGLAYVLFTSGSTGSPKGVAITHRGAVAMVTWAGAAFRPDELAGVIASTSVGFDLSVFELFAPLCTGGAAILVDGPLAAADLEDGATLLNTVPSAMSALLLAGGPPASVRTVCLAGEALTAALAARVGAGPGGPRLLNLYGPTECTTYATCEEVATAAEPVAIGRPIAGMEAYLLDDAGQPVPVGIPGALHLGGGGLARGYLGQPGLTAERFVPDGLSGRPGSRLYRTGDVASWLSDGRLQFLGRADRQVKLRGYRIEPGEVEAALLAHPGVRDAAVEVRDAGGDRRLVAYVVIADGGPDAASLLAHAGERLPAPMVPAALVRLPALPLTPNGKVDRAALPAPQSDAAPHVEPRDDVERRLAAVWADVLGRERLGVETGFFELGGTSLLATALVARVRHELGWNVELRALLRAPTVAGMAALVRAAAVPATASPPPARPRPALRPDPARAHEPFPLTDVQEAYWLGRDEAFELGSVAAHGYLEIEVDDLDVGRYEQAWRRVVDRHGMLRAIVLDDGTQRVLERVPPYRVEVLDASGFSGEEQERLLAGVRDRMSHEVRRPDQWPLFDARVTRLDARRWRLHLSMDLLVVDGWSSQIVLDELQRLYTDPDLELETLELSFRDYVLAERQLRRGEQYRRSRRYWMDRLADLPGPPALPLAADPGRLDSPVFRRRRAELDEATSRALQRRAERTGVTPSVLFAAAFGEVLGTWSREPRFTLTLTTFNRLPVHEQVNRLVGDFTSLTLLAMEHRPRDTFDERARRLQEQLWSDMDHRHMSAVEVLRELSRMRRGLPGALMPVVFTSTLGQGMARTGPRLLNGREVFGLSQTPQVWLDHQIREVGDRIVYNWDAVDQLFPEGLLDDLFAAYGGLLRRLAEGAERAGPGLVPEAHLRRRPRPVVAPAPGELLHDAALRAGAERPEATAVVDGDGRRVTYGTLVAEGARLSEALARLGAGRGRLVAVVTEKGWEQAAAVLGVVRAGAAYVPVDPELPAERIHALLEHGEVELVVTQARLAEREWPARVRRVLVVGRPEPGDEPATPAPEHGRPDDLAYVIYTSGSTGQPKGVMIDHQGAVNTIRAVNSRFAVGPDDRVLALSALGFDLSVYDLFGLLGAGGTVVLPGVGREREPAHWAELIRAHGVTVWNTVPALMELLVEHLEERGEALPATLRVVMLSGDWIPVTLPGRLRRLAGTELEIMSLGGATEASIWSVWYPIGEVGEDWTSIPYGRPMPNQTMDVLDAEMAPRPDWVAGDLYIGGAGVALGYWKDEERTAASFVRHPVTGERLYRTGDVARWMGDGNLEFLGREDLQVKVQGHRIELGEIEAALLAHESLAAAVVTAVGEQRGRKRLVGYVVPRRDTAVDDGELRRHLLGKLPEYMVPAIWVQLDEVPLTANGKVDRRALPAPLEAGDDAAPEPPRDEVEEQLAGLWSEVLGVAAVGVETSFFALGGTSLEAVHFVQRAREELGVELMMRELFAEPTVRGLAAVVGRRGGLSGPRVRRAPARPPDDAAVDGAASLALPAGTASVAELFRRTSRTFLVEPVPLERLAGLLWRLRRIDVDGLPKHRYPSAGSKYPVRTYVAVEPGRVAGLDGGAYRYDPRVHALVAAGPGARLTREEHAPDNRHIADQAAFALLLVADLAALEPEYGEMARDFCLVEAGAMSQLLMEGAHEEGLGLCPIGLLNFVRVHAALGLTDRHVLVHSLLGGAADVSLSGLAAAYRDAAEARRLTVRPD